MAKGRRLPTTTSRSERLLGSYNHGHSQGSTFTESSELGEDDLWSTVDNEIDREENQTVNDNDSASEWSSSASVETNGSYSGRSRRRVVPRGDRHVGGLSLAFEDSGMNLATQPRIVERFHGRDSVASSCGRHMATSAPVNVPDWSKILRVDSVESLHDLADVPDDFDSEMVPPHEYLARSRKMSATSVFEGVGRTLKGRDLSRVRDAVWSQTGFDG